jgi:hypothetical protein
VKDGTISFGIVVTELASQLCSFPRIKIFVLAAIVAVGRHTFNECTLACTSDQRIHCNILAAGLTHRTPAFIREEHAASMAPIFTVGASFTVYGGSRYNKQQLRDGGRIPHPSGADLPLCSRSTQSILLSAPWQ